MTRSWLPRLAVVPAAFAATITVAACAPNAVQQGAPQASPKAGASTPAASTPAASSKAGASTPAASPAAGTGGGSVPAGKDTGGKLPSPQTAVLVKLQEAADGLVLTIARDGSIGTHPIGADTGERELFQLVPRNDGRYLVKTAKLRTVEGGELNCLAPRGRGLGITNCDEGAANQAFELQPAGGGRWSLVVQGQHLQMNREGKIFLEELGDAAPSATVDFVRAP